MIEIDGEFFDNPCEMAKFSKQMKIGVALISFNCQLMAMISEPLFPNTFEQGDIISVNKRGTE